MATVLRHFRVCTVILLPSLIASSAAGAEPGREWAILIGVNEYSNLTHLKCCVKDQQSLHEALLHCGIPDEQMFVLHDQMKEQKYKPIRNNINKQIDIVLELVNKQHKNNRTDLVLIAFSGHGIQVPDESGKNVTYLCPADADLDNPEETMISVDALYKRLESCKADFKLMVVDACRDDPRPPNRRLARSVSDANKSFAESMAAPRGGVLLMSCEPRQQAHEDPKNESNPEALGQGVFMYFLQKGLLGAADRDHDGKISVLELYEYAEHQTGVYVARKFNGPQHPCLNGTMSGAWQFRVPAKIAVITNSIGVELVVVPAGEFEMGIDDSMDELARLFPYTTKDRFQDATQWHHVRITKPFMLGKYEVTIRQFRQFVSESGYVTEAEKDDNGGWGYDPEQKNLLQEKRFNWKYTGFEPPASDDHPVVNVTWNDVIRFCNWLSQKEGKPEYYIINGTDVSVNGGNGYRLPTEAEWEYACRGGTTTRYSFGNDPEALTISGNTADASMRTRFPDAKNFLTGNDGYCFTAPIGRFTANRFGLCDMHGNVSEWCGDWYSDEYYATSSVNDPQGPPSGLGRVDRGGCWSYNAPYCQSAARNWLYPNLGRANLGFRLAAVPSGD